MPTVTEVITGMGMVQGAGPNYYSNQGYPHVHIGSDNGAADVADLQEARARIDFAVISMGGERPNIVVYRVNDQRFALVNGVCTITDENHKEQIERELYANLPMADAQRFQACLNSVLGVGLDL